MGQTVIGFFEDASDAQRAVSRLEEIGISRQSVDISSRMTEEGTTDVKGRNTNRITDFFNSLFGSDSEDARRYASVGERCTMVTVHAQSSDLAGRVADLLDDCGAVDVDEHSARFASGRYDSDSHHEVSGEREASIPRIQENLEVGKRTVVNGGVRVRSRIVERPVEQQVRLREEQVHIERQPVDRPVSGDELSRVGEQEIEMRERSEVPVVNKEARLVEEVRVSKEVNERDETVRDKVRDTEVDVDRLDRNESRRDSDLDDTRRSSF